MAHKTKTSASTATLFLFLAAFSATFLGCSSDSGRPSPAKPQANPVSPTSSGSSIVLALNGNVYPIGYYFVTLNIGQHPTMGFSLDIDTGSDLTWVQCDAPCTGCTLPPENLYKPKDNLMKCGEPLCAAFTDQPCPSPGDQCDYEVHYADSGSSLGVIVKDSSYLFFRNNAFIAPTLAFGCGYDQRYFGLNPPPTGGVLGLGKGKGSIVSQLHDMGAIKNVVCQCLAREGGYLFFGGDDIVPSTGMVWTPMSTNPSEKHYVSGPAEVYFDGKTTGVKDLNMIFDSGSSYTYLSSQPYQALVDLIRQDINGKPLTETKEDQTLPICWKGAKPFTSILEVRDFFKPVAMAFTNANNIQLQVSPEAYLILNEQGNVCLGILNGSEVGLGTQNIIGDNFMLDKMVVYDNEKQQIGWFSAECENLPPN